MFDFFITRFLICASIAEKIHKICSSNSKQCMCVFFIATWIFPCREIVVGFGDCWLLCCNSVCGNCDAIRLWKQWIALYSTRMQLGKAFFAKVLYLNMKFSISTDHSVVITDHYAQNLAVESFNSCLHPDDKTSNLFKALTSCLDSIKKKTTSHGYLVKFRVVILLWHANFPRETDAEEEKLKKCWHPSDRIGNATCKQPRTRRANTNFIHGDKTTFLSLSPAPARVAYFIRFPCRTDGPLRECKGSS